MADPFLPSSPLRRSKSTEPVWTQAPIAASRRSGQHARCAMCTVSIAPDQEQYNMYFRSDEAEGMPEAVTVHGSCWQMFNEA